MFELRKYQSDCVQAIADTFETSDSQLIQAPTGSGKTVILWSYIRSSGKKALIVAPTKELTEQLYDTGCAIVGEDNVYLKRTSYWPKDRHVIMTPQALTFALKTRSLTDIELLVIDEAHRAMSSTYRNILECLAPGTQVLGLSATPERLDGQNLLDVFNTLSFECSLLDLIEQKYLVDLECWKLQTQCKLHADRSKDGDFTHSTLKQLDTDTRNGFIVKTYMDRCQGSKTLIFCLNIEHGKTIASQLRDKGVAAANIYGAMGRSERRQILNDYRDGALDVLCNAQLLTEGFDMPSIESIVLARPTRSKALYCQMIGRSVRPYPGKTTAKIYDLSDEIHDICSFNVLGSVPEDFGDGRTLTQGIRERKESPGIDVELDYKKFNLFQSKENPLSKPALPCQIQALESVGAPWLPDITIQEAAYLLFKTRLLENNGFDQRAYWKKWHVLPSKNSQTWA